MKRIKLPSKYRLQGLQNMIFISGMLILRILLLLLQMILCSSKQHKLVKKMEQNFQNSSLEEKAALIKSLSSDILAEGRTDLLLKAIGVPVLEQLRIEAARATLSRLVITEDCRFSASRLSQRGVFNSHPQSPLYAFFESSRRY